jgi:octanoyl-[GcvH]:protein N-octanoyltransferase
VEHLRPRRIRLLTESFPDRPSFDTAVSHALLRRASAGLGSETLRFHRPGPIVAFGRQDVAAPGYRSAVQAARRGGFEAVERLAGGRAAVFHQRTIAFSWCIPTPTPRETITQRFGELDDVVAGGLRRLGVDAHIGEIAGEYCPGRYSVNARGEKKIMGVGQRLLRRAAHVGGVVVVAGADQVRDILVPVYRALQLDWRPQTVGSIEEEVGPVSYETAVQALLDELSHRHELVEGELGPEDLALAEELAPQHLAP